MIGGGRTEHPFHMYDAMLAQPEAFAEVVGRNEPLAEEFAARAASCERVFFVGIGTSYHAAQLGEHLGRAYGGGMDVRAINSFDFVLYGPELTSEDCIVCVSHRGTKRFSAEALRRVAGAGCLTALITGKDAVSKVASADATFETVEQEKSSAFTISYTGAIATLASLARHLGRLRGGGPGLSESHLRKEIPSAVREGLRSEDAAASLAREHAGSRRIWLLGGGPSAVTASEIALKIRETSYLQAEGMPTEFMLHGPLQCAEADDLFVLIAPAGAAQERIFELAGAAREIGAPYVVVGDGTAEHLRRGAAGWIVVPEVPEPFTALTCLMPLQLFAYHLALSRGTNPDVFRTDDPRFARVREQVTM